MKKRAWIIIALILAAAVLFAIFYQNIKLFWLPVGNPSERPFEN